MFKRQALDKTGEAHIEELMSELEAVDVNDNDETPINFHIGESTP